MAGRWLFSSFVAWAVIAGASLPARGDVKLSPLFSDSMVLQREMAVPVWGTAAPDEKVSVKFRGKEKSVTAGADGKWSVKLEPLTAGGPDELTIAGNNSITIKDVLVGEVWVGSGQSNMQGTTGGYAKGDEVLAKLAAAGPYPQLRLVRGRGPWGPSTPENINAFSAIHFAFGQKLQQELGVPVGLMVGAVGGTPSGAWISEASLAADKPCQEQLAAAEKNRPNAVAAYEKQLAAWEKLPEAERDPKKKPQPPAATGTVRGQKPGYLYEAHIRPFQPYGIRGVLWDQGESGTAIEGVDQYTLMGGLIRGWRNEWGQGEFPFLYVQKPSGGGCAWDPSNPVTSRAEPFASQLPPKPPAAAEGNYLEIHQRIMTYPNTAMVSSGDLGSGIHPSNKSGYGHRGAAVALGLVYKKPVQYYGPIYDSHAIESGKVRVKFAQVGQGLAARHSEKLQGFAIAGEDGVYHWADATIDGDSVVVSSAAVPKPASVTYAWSNRHNWANLFNKDGLPALSFKTK